MKIHYDQNMSTTEAFYKIIKVQDKIKYKTFGKVKFKKVKDDKDLMEIYANRNKVIDNINDGIEDAEALTSNAESLAHQAGGEPLGDGHGRDVCLPQAGSSVGAADLLVDIEERDVHQTVNSETP